ncbi:hypothetical protein [Pseudomonas sp. MWU12-2037]|uniref:hypothetical protein n=1 Tax=Pseudomonas sp. MWU12-2037 TaxID=2928690 RepID=UPI00200C4C17|nr:hypothetical protein [Pseudomonas sp. MWU12-2037]
MKSPSAHAQQIQETPIAQQRLAEADPVAEGLVTEQGTLYGKNEVSGFMFLYCWALLLEVE